MIFELATLTIKSFSHFLAWVHGKLKAVLHEIGLQNMAKAAIKPLERLSRKDKIAVLQRIKAFLTVQTKTKTKKIQYNKQKTKTSTVKSDVYANLEYLYALAKAKPVPSEPPKHYHKIRQHGQVLYV